MDNAKLRNWNQKHDLNFLSLTKISILHWFFNILSFFPPPPTQNSFPNSQKITQSQTIFSRWRHARKGRRRSYVLYTTSPTSQWVRWLDEELGKGRGGWRRLWLDNGVKGEVSHIIIGEFQKLMNHRNILLFLYIYLLHIELPLPPWFVLAPPPPSQWKTRPRPFPPI